MVTWYNASQYKAVFESQVDAEAALGELAVQEGYLAGRIRFATSPEFEWRVDAFFEDTTVPAMSWPLEYVGSVDMSRALAWILALGPFRRLRRASRTEFHVRTNEGLEGVFLSADPAVGYASELTEGQGVIAWVLRSDVVQDRSNSGRHADSVDGGMIKLKDRQRGSISLRLRDGIVIGAMGSEPGRFIGKTLDEAKHIARYGGTGRRRSRQ